MLTLTITKNNVIDQASTYLPHLAAIMDGSLRMRLRLMRGRNGSKVFIPPMVFDNCVTRVFQSLYNFSRIKHADRIGISYWKSTELELKKVNAANYSDMLYGKFRSMQQQSAILEGTLELPQTAWASELSNLHTFMASTSKNRIVGQYINLPEGRDFIPNSRSSEFNLADDDPTWQSSFPVTAAPDIDALFAPTFDEWESMSMVTAADATNNLPLPRKPRAKRITKNNCQVVESTPAVLKKVIEASVKPQRKSSNKISTSSELVTTERQRVMA